MSVVKHRRSTIRHLQELGLPVVAGRSYVRKEWLPKHPVSLETLHRKLAVFRGSLAEELAHLREEG